MGKGKIFRVEVRCAFPEWDRYDVYMIAACFDDAGERTDYVNVTDKRSALETSPCHHADLYLYIVAREFPASPLISASPPFEISLVVATDGGKPSLKTFEVNQWGGLSVKRSLS
jgi:hypothetical protein